jgi:2-methylcitrate dehydratase PrpD
VTTERAVSARTAVLAEYIAAAATRQLPEEVRARATLHLLDSVAAVVSGSALPAGRQARRWYAGAFGATQGPATVVGGGRGAPSFAAAVCNGMSAHAAETDDSHGSTLSHPGCAALPAALAAAEASGCSGRLLLRAFAAGYDVGCRVGRSAHSADRGPVVGRWSSHAVVGTFTAAAAAGVASSLDAGSCQFLLSYAAQLASGVTTWVRDTGHVEKAFVFGGMPAGHGVLAASLAGAGCTGVPDVFDGTPNWIEAVCRDPEPAALTDGLGVRYEIMDTTLKYYAAGSPCQAPLAAVGMLLASGDVTADAVDSVDVVLEPRGAAIVDNRAMPNVNLQYLIAGSLLDGGYSRRMAQDADRMNDPRVRALMARVRLVPDPALTGTRTATVRVTADAGATRWERTVREVRGSPRDPLGAEDVTAKSLDLLTEVMPLTPAGEIVTTVLDIDMAPDLTKLTALLRSAENASGKKEES